MEFIIIILLVIALIWAVWKMRIKVRASREATLDQAWREVLDDPNYNHRRRYEERKREDEARARKAEGL